MAGLQLLNILSWNVRGLCDPHRKVRIRNWINGLHHKVDILMLQELKADDFRLEIALAYILPSYQVVSQADSTSDSPLLSGEELEEWRLLKLKLSLKDAACTTTITGPKYTRRGTFENHIVQSRLDRFYFSN
jgi:exonuclease III